MMAALPARVSKRRCFSGLLALFLLVGLAWPSPVVANGLTTHVWITRTAKDQVPPGPLADFLADPGLQDALISGTIFPDGGYAVGDGYGEIAHWEPFHLRFIDWVRTHHGPPYDDVESRRLVAFALGLASHGMADQIFDGLYMERARQHDHASDWSLSMDEATDVAMAAIVGAQPVPERFVPEAALLEIFEDRGHRVSQDTLQRGQSLVGFAVAVVGMLGQDREAVRDYRQQFPWATAHIDDPAVPGGPRFETEIIARYWARIWARLHGELADDDVLMGTVPATEPRGHELLAERVESRVSFIFSRRLFRRDVTPEAFSWTAADGTAVPFDVRLFYGDDAHMVHLIPQEDLQKDTDYEVQLLPGLRTADGIEVPEAVSVSVSTRPVPEPAPVMPPAESSGCRTVPTPSLSVLGLALGLFVIRRRAGRPVPR